MKIGLIVPGNLWFSPYVNIYTDILTQNNIEYEIISWNRDGADKEGDTTFNLNVNTLKRHEKVIPFLKYLSYIKSTVRKNNYDKLIVFGPQTALLLYSFLKKEYKNKFILDYRDLSIEQLPVLKNLFKKVLNISSINIISSEGFKKHLPPSDYLISHNLNSNALKGDRINEGINLRTDEISVLTIGSIRDYESNLEVVKALANKKNFKLFFVGKGDASTMLEKYAIENKIENIFFHGFYKKEEEVDFINKCTFLNIYYPKIKSHSSALSNRFYNGVIYNRPMIVTSNSIQGEFIEQYNLGVSIDDCDNLDEKLLKFKNEFNQTEFTESARELLENFKKDYFAFIEKVSNFLRTN